MKIYLSYSSLNMLHNSSHQWACKMMGIEVPRNIYFDGGNYGQRIIQAHVSGKKKFDILEKLTQPFTVVEEKQFDERCKFVKHIEYGSDTIIIQGFADGLNPTEKRMMEIKLSSTPWSIGKYKKSMQRKIYAWGFPQYEKGLLVTGMMLTREQIQEAGNDWLNWKAEDWEKRILENWTESPPTASECAMTKEDAQEAEEYILKGIEILRAGDFTGGLENGVCTDRYCLYGDNCYFK